MIQLDIISVRQFMSAITTTDSLIVETPRGPSIAGTRITVYSVMDYLKANRSWEHILQFLHVTPEQLDAAIEYIEQHWEEVERDYQSILRRSQELRGHYEKVFREHSPYPPDMPWEEKRKLLIQKLQVKYRASQAHI
jgi:uncharacterized protein (DUF433 family)